MNKQIIHLQGAKLNIFIRDEADSSIAAEIFKLREYKTAEDIIKHAKWPIIDAGAHFGLFSMYARIFNVNVPILAIEPEPENIKFLEKHLKSNKINNVKIIVGALSKETGKRKLFKSKDSHDHHLVHAEEDAENPDLIVVPTYSLKDIFKKYKLKKISLFKLDIEGGEYEVFESLQPNDFEKIEAVVMEYHNYNRKHYSEIEQLLRKNGFSVQIFPSKFDNKMGFIFAKNKRKNF